MKIALTGSKGLVGSRIVELLAQDFEFIHFERPEFDITDKSRITTSLAEQDFDLFLHLAAYTNVDGAETEKETAYKINVDGTRNIFEAVKNRGKKLIYISTGFVFDGIKPPYYEDSPAHPLSYYGQTKYDGEKIVMDEAMIVRLEYPYRSNFDLKKDFVRTIKSRLESGQEIAGITDSLITPTFIDDIAYGLKYLMNNFSPEIYHLIGADCLSPYDAAIVVAKNWNLDASLVKKTTYEEYFKGKALRPKLADVRSKKNNFYKMKTFREGLQVIK